MKEHPILFSAPMVRALLAGTKTQTRRVVKGSEKWPPCVVRSTRELGRDNTVMGVCARRGTYGPSIKSPYGGPGDRLWVRETVFINHYMGLQVPPSDRSACELWFRATDEDDIRNWEDSEGLRWTPSIHMPRWASRILLDVTDVRVERLQDISEADAIAEGIEKIKSGHWSLYGQADTSGTYSPRASYRALWESINGAGSWDANPWVWIVEFKRAQASTGEESR